MKTYLWVALILGGAAIGGSAWWLMDGSDDALGNDGKSYVTVAVVTGDIEDVVTAQGTLEPKNYVDVGVQVSGQLKKIHVAIGDEVTKGDLIAEIDPQTYEARVQVDAAHINDLTAQIAQQKAVMEKNNRDWIRNKAMAKSKAVSDQIVQDSETALKTASSVLDSLQAQLAGAQSTLEGDLASLSYTKIYAPMSGTVLTQDPREGQTLNATQTAPVVVRVGDLDILTVRAQVAEADVMNLKIDMPVYFTTLRSPDIKWQGVVRLIQPSPVVINQVVLYDVLVDVTNKDRKLMTGMSTQTFFVVAKVAKVPVIPVTALGKRVIKEDNAQGQGYKIRLVRAKEIMEKTIHVGLMDRKLAEIKDGLSLGDNVILNAPSSTNGGQSRPRMMGGPRL